MATPLTGIKEEMLLAPFMKGLNDKVRTELKVLGPLNLVQAMKWSVNIEEKLIRHYGPYSNRSKNTYPLDPPTKLFRSKLLKAHKTHKTKIIPPP